MPPQVRCNITGEYHYYGDTCDCREDIIASKTEELEKIKELLNRPGALMAVNYDSDKAPAVAITGEEAAAAYGSLLNLPKYNECERLSDNKIFAESVMMPTTGLIDTSSEQPCMYCTRCLVCGTDVPVHFLGGGPLVCPECKKTIKFIKEKFKEELENYEV
jgi:hypothetical protein